MKTLINTANSQIRITAPEIESYREFYTLPDKDFHHLFKMETWTLVEEEPTEGIKGNLEEIPSNMNLEKEVSKWWDAFFPEPDFKFRKHRGHIVSNDVIIKLAKHFYELGLNARKEE